jgi:hypothetical protein
MSHPAYRPPITHVTTYPDRVSPRTVDEAVAQLEQIITSGAPEQITAARTLLHCIEDAECDDSMMDQVGALYDAYLNDPYLTR